MTLEEAIEARHSVRAYKEQPLAENVVKVLEEKIAVLNREGKLHIQLIQNEPKAFLGTMAKYGKFRNVGNYIVMAGQKADDLDERVGYYGEQLVLWVSPTPRCQERMCLTKVKRLPATLPSVMVRHKVSAIRSRPSSK